MIIPFKMSINLSKPFKATFLLLVFTFSTIVSFACAAGLDMGYNEDHHKVQGHLGASEHAGVKHNHAIEGPEVNDLVHHEIKDSHSTESTPDDCCRDEAAKFEKSDKLGPQTFSYSLQSLSITLPIKPYFHLDAVTAFLYSPNLRYFIRNHHPPIADTRIAIQSFLI